MSTSLEPQRWRRFCWGLHESAPGTDFGCIPVAGPPVVWQCSCISVWGSPHTCTAKATCLTLSSQVDFFLYAACSWRRIPSILVSLPTVKLSSLEAWSTSRGALEQSTGRRDHFRKWTGSVCVDVFCGSKLTFNGCKIPPKTNFNWSCELLYLCLCISRNPRLNKWWHICNVYPKHNLAVCWATKIVHQHPAKIIHRFPSVPQPKWKFCETWTTKAI